MQKSRQCLGLCFRLESKTLNTSPQLFVIFGDRVMVFYTVTGLTLQKSPALSIALQTPHNVRTED